MPRISIPLGNGFYQSDSLPLSNQRCVNLYPNLVESEGISPSALFGAPGVKQISSTGDKIENANRGAWTMDGKPYFVNGQTLYRLDRNIVNGEEVWTSVALGEITGSERCSFADNGKQLIIIVPSTPSVGYIFDGELKTITDGDFYAQGNPLHVVFVDSFFIATTDEKKIIKSDSNDGLSWNPLNFGAAVVDPDKIVAPFVFRNQIFIGGSETFEVFENVGGTGFNFSRINGLVIDKGLSSPYAIAGTTDTFLWLGKGDNEDVSIWAFTGSSAQRASTVSIDSILNRLGEGEIENCFAWSYGQDGHFFIGFNFPSITLVYDTTTQRWHERESQVVDNKGFPVNTRCRYNSIVNAYGFLLCGDSQDGRIGVIDRDYYFEYDRPLIATFSLAPFYNNGSSFSVTQCELVGESGVGNPDAPEPEIRMKVSRNGRTFNQSITRKLGKIGEYSKRIIWRRLGRFSRMAVFEFTVSDPVKRAFYLFEANIKGGRDIGN